MSETNGMEVGMAVAISDAAEIDAPVPRKPRAARKTAVLVIGKWKGDVFETSGIQPPSKDSRRIEALRAWLRTPAVMEALTLAGFVEVDIIRREPRGIKYETTTVVKASVR